MSSILTIASKEFKSSFYSLRASMIFFLFTLFLGVFFFYYIDAFMSIQNQASSSGAIQPKLSQLVMAFFESINFLLIFIIPSLTMSAFAEEKKYHSLKLLQASTLTPLQIVVGKYLGNLSVMLLAIVFSFIYPLYLYIYGKIGIGLLVSSYLGVSLLVSFQLAFGLWISVLAHSPFMAFITTLFGLFSLLIVGAFSAMIKANNILQVVLKYVGVSEHYSSFVKGMVTVSDTGYFVLLTLLFLFFSLIAFDGLRWR